MNPLRTTQFRPTLEALEAREVPATITADLRGGVLTVLGTSSIDQIYVTQGGAAVGVVATTRVGSSSFGYSRAFPAAQIQSIVIDAGYGNDHVAINPVIRKPSRVFGGSGNDTMYGGSGTDLMWGGYGNDILFGRVGNDNIFGGAGSDYLNGGVGSNNLFQESLARPSVANAVEQEVVRLVNAERTSRGLRPLTINTLLNGAAKTHATNMAAWSNLVGGSAMQHTLTGTITPTPSSRLDFVGYQNWQTWGENIAYGYATAAAVMQGWMNSPGHRENILNPNFTEIGVGVVANRNGQLYWGQVFGARF